MKLNIFIPFTILDTDVLHHKLFQYCRMVCILSSYITMCIADEFLRMINSSCLIFLSHNNKIGLIAKLEVCRKKKCCKTVKYDNCKNNAVKSVKSLHRQTKKRKKSL